MIFAIAFYAVRVTLRDYIHYVNATVGFSDDVDQQLMEAAEISSLEEYQKCVGIILDEMYIKEGLEYENIQVLS